MKCDLKTGNHNHIMIDILIYHSSYHLIVFHIYISSSWLSLTQTHRLSFSGRQWPPTCTSLCQLLLWAWLEMTDSRFFEHSSEMRLMLQSFAVTRKSALSSFNLASNWHSSLGQPLHECEDCLLVRVLPGPSECIRQARMMGVVYADLPRW